MKTTEQSSNHDHLESKSALELVQGMNAEDKSVAHAVELVLPRIADFVDQLVQRMKNGGRLFYIGAGTSGRLGVLDASECPPTFGIDHHRVIGLIAGGDSAIRKAVENAEDNWDGAWEDLSGFNIGAMDTVVGIAASGTTPYVIGGVKEARSQGLLTACITCNEGSPLAKEVEHPLEVVVGPEFVTGSTRMKSGTAQKMVLNMISTATMIQLGRVKGNKMVDMQLSNEKLVARGTRMVSEATGLPTNEAEQLLLQEGSVRKAVEFFESGRK